MLSLIFYIIKDIIKTRLHRGQNLLKALILPMLSICLIQQLSAQTSPQSSAIKPLQVGDPIPEALWNLPLQVVNHPEGKKEITLADYKDKKLIMIDFWGTWCTPCIQSLDTLNVLQKEFGDQLQVIPATVEPDQKVLSRIKKRDWRLFSLYDQAQLKKYFPHNLLSHQIWLKDNKVFAISSSSYANRENISKVIKGEEVWLDTKIDGKSPEESVDDILNDTTIRYQSAFSKPLPGEYTSFSSRDNLLLCRTMPTFMLFREAFRNQLNPTVKDPIIWEIAPAMYNKLVEVRPQSGGGPENEKRYQNWLDNFCFTYTLKVTNKINRKELFNIFREDLNRFYGSRYGIVGEIEHRKAKAIVLTLANKKVGDVPRQQEISYWNFENLLRKNFPNLPRVTEKGVSDMRIINEGLDTDDPAALSKALLRSGIVFNIEEAAIPFLVIKPVAR